MGVLLQINRFVAKIEVWLLSYCIMLMAVLLIINVIGRSLFNHSFSWVEEVGQMLLLVTTFIGASNAARLGKHIVMTALFDTLPVKIKKVLLCFTSGVTFLGLLYFAYLCYGYVLRVQAMGRITSALEIPIWLVFAVVPIGFFLTAIQYLINLILNIRHKDVLYIGPECPASDKGSEENCTAAF